MSRLQINSEELSAGQRLAVLLREPFLDATERLIERFAERGHTAIRTPHANVFPYLDREGTRVVELAGRAQITRQSMAELVGHLERENYLERVKDPSDGRAKLVRATERGEQLFAIAREFMEETEAEWRRALGKEDLETLRTLLERLNARIGERGQSLQSRPRACKGDDASAARSLRKGQDNGAC